jgi:hypothetical protein
MEGKTFHDVVTQHSTCYLFKDYSHQKSFKNLLSLRPGGPEPEFWVTVAAPRLFRNSLDTKNGRLFCQYFQLVSSIVLYFIRYLLLNMPFLGFHYSGGCCDWTQDYSWRVRIDRSTSRWPIYIWSTHTSTVHLIHTTFCLFGLNLIHKLECCGTVMISFCHGSDFGKVSVPDPANIWDSLSTTKNVYEILLFQC